MKRRALIIYCDNTKSGKLSGPSQDNLNFREVLESDLGGGWYSSEVKSLQNPTKEEIEFGVNEFCKDSDYTFIIFTGHGFTDSETNEQYFEIKDCEIPISDLKTYAKRQTILIDSCRGYDKVSESLSDKFFMEAKLTYSTRKLFDSEVLKCEEGITLLYSASVNQSSSDSDEGGVYILSLIKSIKYWNNNYKNALKLDLKICHTLAVQFLKQDYKLTIQEPQIMPEKRRNYFPIAVNTPKEPFY